MSEWMMIPSLLPVSYSILQVRNDLREAGLIPNVRRVIRIEAEEEVFGSSRVGTLVGPKRKQFMELVVLMRYVQRYIYKC